MGTGVCVKLITYEQKLFDIPSLSQFKRMTVSRKSDKEVFLKEEECINAALNNLHVDGKIDKTLFKEMKSVGSQLPRLYGLAKVHKASVPVRPALSMPGLPYYRIAEKVTKWLSVIPQSKINCTSKKTVDHLKMMSLDPDEMMISFDVISLYTNVPVDEAIEEAAILPFSGESPKPPINKQTLVTLAQLATTNVNLPTHNGQYKQVDGLAMGSQQAPYLANIC